MAFFSKLHERAGTHTDTHTHTHAHTHTRTHAHAHTHESKEILRVDPDLVAHEEHLRYRFSQYTATRAAIERAEGGLAQFALACLCAVLVRVCVRVCVRTPGVFSAWRRLSAERAIS